MENNFEIQNGKEMYALAQELFPICRSITGNGVRKTLQIIKNYLPELEINEVPTGTKAFDWQVPKEWNIEAAYIENEQGEKIVDFANNNLHVMGYSLPVDAWLDREQLLEHVYVANINDEAIPYVTSYYNERWGFCMTKNMRDSLPDGKYHAVIKSTLENGSLTYGECVIKGETQEEILLSTYVCHPSMANNEISGPCLAIALAQWVKKLSNRRYTYRILFVPETIGSIVYISKNLQSLQKNVKAGYILTCEGDDNAYSYVPTKRGQTLADRAALHALNFYTNGFDAYTFLQRGSDERQYNSAGVDMPVCSVMRSKYHVFKEYHTSADDLSYISPEGLMGAFNVHKHILLALEYNYYYCMTCACEPQLGKRGLYPTISQRCSASEVKNMTNFIAYADGKEDLIGIASRINVGIDELCNIIEKLTQHNLLTKHTNPV